MNNSLSTKIRNKKLGLLILDARNHEHRSIEACAEAIQVSVEQFQSFENGDQSPSLPQLELLAWFLNLPMDHFWGSSVIADNDLPESIQEKERLLQLRNRIIGASLKLGRNQAGLGMPEITGQTGLSEEQITAYESGNEAVPLAHLEALAALYQMPVSQFYDQHGPVGKRRAQQEISQKFNELPAEMQQFVTNPMNRPYLDLAVRLSALSADKLRAVAEGLLEITI
jgi:transcriptional regulator with XRE-family HTH domain